MKPTTIAIAATTALLAACGSSGEGGAQGTASEGAPTAGPVGPTAQAPEAPLERRPIDPATTGSVRGTVRFSGDAPPIRELEDVPKQPGCHEGHDTPPVSEFFLVRDGAVQNVIVQVDAGLEGWEMPPAPDEAPRLVQRGCIYRPHVLGMRAGQTLSIENGDPTNHNVNARARKNKSFNENQAPGGRDLTVVFDKAEVVPFQCDIHPWMSSHVAVFDHPFYAITGADGAFAIEGLPPGEYELEAVHPDNKKIGKRGKLRQTVTVAAGETTEVAFTY